MGAVIGAGSVVTKSIPPYTVAVGNPCKVKKRIFTDEVLEEHLKNLNYSKETIKNVISKRNAETSLKDYETIDNSETINIV